MEKSKIEYRNKLCQIFYDRKLYNPYKDFDCDIINSLYSHNFTKSEAKTAIQFINNQINKALKE